MTEAGEILSHLRSMMREMDRFPPPIRDMHLGFSAQKWLNSNTLYPARGPSNILRGIPVYSSPLFPYTSECSKCNGTGDGGEESTYCQRCKGQGAQRIEGTMSQGDQLILLTSALPKKFPIAWAAAALPKRPSQGIRSVPWPA